MLNTDIRYGRYHAAGSNRKNQLAVFSGRGIQLKVRFYSEEDLFGLTQLMNQWSDTIQYTESGIRSTIDTIRQESGNKIFVAQNGEEKVIGYLFAGICYHLGSRPFAEVIQLLVDKDNRSQGIGAALIEHVSAFYKAQGIEEIKLHSRVERERAHSFYRKLGFKEFKRSAFFGKEL